MENELPSQVRNETLKDVDLEELICRGMLNIAIKRDNGDEEEDHHLRRKVIATIERDMEFLRQCNFMDYSLLLGIEKLGEGT